MIFKGGMLCPRQGTIPCNWPHRWQPHGSNQKVSCHDVFEIHTVNTLELKLKPSFSQRAHRVSKNRKGCSKASHWAHSWRGLVYNNSLLKPTSVCQPCEQADGVVFPGGFGAAKNLSTFGYEGADMSVDAEVNCLFSKIGNLFLPVTRFLEYWRSSMVLASPRHCAALLQLSLPRWSFKKSKFAGRALFRLSPLSSLFFEGTRQQRGVPDPGKPRKWSRLAIPGGNWSSKGEFSCWRQICS